MSINDTLDRALEQARDLQQSISDAVNKATDQLKPQVENSLHVARDLQATLTKHVEASGELTIKNTAAALHHLQDYIALGVGALSDSSEQLRIAAKKLVEQSQKITEAAAAAATSAIHAPATDETTGASGSQGKENAKGPAEPQQP